MSADIPCNPEGLGGNNGGRSHLTKTVTAMPVTAMPVTAMPLTDTAIHSAKSGPKAKKLRDGSGLYLLVNTDGSRWWRLDYDGQSRANETR